MANKRRPKKIRPPYKKYVYRLSVNEESDDEEQRQISDKYGNWQDFSSETNPNIHSIYVLSDQPQYKGKIWPRLQFEKVDVLFWCLHPEHRAHLQELEEKEKQNGFLRFPLEIIVWVLKILHSQGKLKPKFLRLNKLFYALSLPLLYERPNLHGNNFFQFVDTISANKTIGEFIRDLDLLRVNQLGKNAFVAKLLKRSRPNLESFTAPQTSFGLGPLVALRNCHDLKILDLRLVSETLNLEELFHLIRHLDQLTHLLFPRLSLEINDYSNVKWPPKLRYLRVAGGISDDFLVHSDFPKSICHMEFAHCPRVAHLGFQHFLLKVGPNLKSLRIQFPMPGLQANLLDTVFLYCPNLLVLEVAVDYVSSRFFDEDLLPLLPYPRPLKNLIVDSSGMLGTNDKVDPVDLALAMNEERLPNLKNVRCTAKLGWDPKSEYVSFVADELDDRGGGLYIGY